MDMDRLLESVKKHEGYRNKVYLDTLGKRTVGVGHLCVEDFWEDDKEYEEKFLMEILQKDLQEAIRGARSLMEDHGCADIDEQAEEILIEMVFQLGMTGVSKFKNMWKALAELNYVGASYEMLDSRWSKANPKQSKSHGENNEGDYMIYKGQKLSDNLTQSQRDMFKYMIDNGHSVDDIVKMYLGNVKDTFFTLEEKEEQ
jgi:lysozyme